MKKALIPALLVLFGSAVLGATVFREPLASAARLAQAVVVANTPDQPVPVQAAQPAHSFSLVPGSQGLHIEDGCEQSLPAGTRWFISSFAVSNHSDSDGDAAIALFLREGNGITELVTFGPDVSVKAHETVQLTFPQPFVLTAPQAGVCLKNILNGLIDTIVVGYRQ